MTAEHFLFLTVGVYILCAIYHNIGEPKNLPEETPLGGMADTTDLKSVGFGCSGSSPEAETS